MVQRVHRRIAHITGDAGLLQGLRDAYTDGGKTVNIIGPPYSNPRYTKTYAQVKSSTLLCTLVLRKWAHWKNARWKPTCVMQVQYNAGTCRRAGCVLLVLQVVLQVSHLIRCSALSGNLVSVSLSERYQEPSSSMLWLWPTYLNCACQSLVYVTTQVKIEAANQHCICHADTLSLFSLVRVYP